jgi:hypothetical protein
MRGKLAVQKAQLERLSYSFKHIPRFMFFPQEREAQHAERQPAFAEPESTLVVFKPQKEQRGTRPCYEKELTAGR